MLETETNIGVAYAVYQGPISHSLAPQFPIPGKCLYKIHCIIYHWYIPTPALVSFSQRTYHTTMTIIPRLPLSEYMRTTNWLHVCTQNCTSVFCVYACTNGLAFICVFIYPHAHVGICIMFRFMRIISCRWRLGTSFYNRKQKPKHPILSQGTLMFLIRSLSYMIIK